MYDTLEKVALTMQSTLEEFENFIESNELSDEIIDELFEIKEQFEFAFNSLLGEIS